EAIGVAFGERMPQQILAIEGPPRLPVAIGEARPVSAADAPVFADWRLAFTREATPHDPVPERAALEKMAVSGDHLLWIVDGAPVRVASRGRRTRRGLGVNGVYTPPALRGRGYAG